MNSFLTDSNGAFQPGKAVALKGGVLAATGIAQYLLIRKWAPLIKLFSIVNFGAWVAETGIAAHNFTLPK